MILRLAPPAIAIGLALLTLGCGGQTAAARPWTASVDVSGNRVRITVDVPGWAMGRDYHAHFNLDGGPEVMAFTTTYTFRNLAPGSHTIRVAIADAAHRAIPGMERRFEVRVE